MEWKKACGFLTKYPADSFEWCPFQTHADYFTCGTYYLIEGQVTQERIGMIYLMKFDEGEVRNVQEIATDGILDVKWCLETIGDGMLVAAATATGDVRVFQFTGNSLNCLDSLCLRDGVEGDYMVLAVNWFKISETEAKICFTDNKGGAGIVLYRSGKLSQLEKWNAHSLEAWTVAFDTGCSEILFTGGDDAKLKIWDRRSSTSKAISSQDTGVTIIETNTRKPNTILSGSFDEILNVWDTRLMKKPVSDVKCSGGLWRIKCKENLILTANIYGGFQIIDFSSLKVLGEFREHASLAYGADWGKATEKRFYVGTCSFYDKLLCISTWEP